MEVGVNLLDLLTPEIILGELIVMGVVSVLAIGLVTLIYKWGVKKGSEDEKNNNTASILEKHLVECSEKNEAVDARLDKLEQELVGVKTKVDLIYDAVCKKND